MPSYSGVWTLTAQYQAQAQGLWPAPPAIGLFGGGYNGSSSTNVISKVNIVNTGNATDFGDLTLALQYPGACGAATRGIFAGSDNTSNVINYVTFSSEANAIDFGDLSYARGRDSGLSNATRGLFCGGYTSTPSETRSCVIDYVTIATTGNATNFGNLISLNLGVEWPGGACASSTRGVYAGGFGGALGAVNVIQYVTIASTGNAADFGDLTQGFYSLSGCSSATRGLFGGGRTGASIINVIEYITIASLGNSIDFGDLTVARNETAACSSATIGLFAGGYTGSVYSNVIDTVTIATVGNASDFGDLTQTTSAIAGCSNAHGGL